MSERPTEWASFSAWLADRLGTRRWVVAARLTPRLAMKYDVAVSGKKFRELEQEFETMKRIRA